MHPQMSLRGFWLLSLCLAKYTLPSNLQNFLLVALVVWRRPPKLSLVTLQGHPGEHRELPAFVRQRGGGGRREGGEGLCAARCQGRHRERGRGGSGGCAASFPAGQGGRGPAAPGRGGHHGAHPQALHDGKVAGAPQERRGTKRKTSPAVVDATFFGKFSLPVLPQPPCVRLFDGPGRRTPLPRALERISDRGAYRAFKSGLSISARRRRGVAVLLRAAILMMARQRGGSGRSPLHRKLPCSLTVHQSCGSR